MAYTFERRVARQLRRNGESSAGSTHIASMSEMLIAYCLSLLHGVRACLRVLCNGLKEKVKMEV